jgi:acetolactate synthase-1/2/3 large subunit
VVEEAVALAFEGRPGPVHIHVPEDLTLQGQSVENYRNITLNVQSVLPNPAKIAAAASTIANALRERKSVIVLIGFGAVRSRAGPELQAFVERFQIPFVTTLDGKGIIAEDHPLSLGVFADSGHASAGKAFVAADFVIAVGNSFAQHATFDFRSDLLAGKTLVHVNISAQEINKVYVADHAVIADAKLAVAALTTALSPLVDSVSAAHVEKDRHITAPLINLEPSHVHPGQLAQSLSKMLPDNSIVLADAGAQFIGSTRSRVQGQNSRQAPRISARVSLLSRFQSLFVQSARLDNSVSSRRYDAPIYQCADVSVD